MERWLARPLPGIRYAAVGLLLAVVKIAIDYATARAYGHPYSILFYVSPLDAPLLHPGADRAYWVALAVVGAPFVAVGVALTARRLVDAALSPWFALLFFAPFANLLFFFTMALMPTRPRARALPLPDAAYRAPGGPVMVPPDAPFHRRHPILVSGVFGAVFSLGALGVSVGLLRQYGLALLVGLPTISGFVTGALYTRFAPRGGFRGALLATILSTTASVVVCLSLAIEGLGCLVIVFPIFFFPSLFGALIGWSAAKNLPPSRSDAALIGSMLSFFVLLGADRVAPLPPLTPPPVETSVEIDAPPARVWAELPEMPALPETDDWVLRYVVAHPVSATIDGRGVGAKRICLLTTGPALETVDEWVPERTLGFTVDVQPDPMRELTLYQTVRQPHLDGYIRNLRGEFSLEALPGNRTRLTGRSWYRVRVAPETYWRWWSDFFVHRVHAQVLGVVKARAEGPARPGELALQRGPGTAFPGHGD